MNLVGSVSGDALVAAGAANEFPLALEHRRISFLQLVLGEDLGIVAHRESLVAAARHVAAGIGQIGDLIAGVGEEIAPDLGEDQAVVLGEPDLVILLVRDLTAFLGDRDQYGPA